MQAEQSTRTNDLLETIASGAAMLDPDQLPAAVELLGHFEALRDDAAAAGNATWQSQAVLAVNAINAIVMRQGDPAEHIQVVRNIARQLQESSGAGARPPTIDSELLAAWLPSAPGVLDEMTNLTVELSGGARDPERFATLKRGLHTLKGECGVIGLNTAQQVCHQIEDALSRCEQLQSDFPTDAVLGVLDWMRNYAQALLSDQQASPPPPPSTAAAISLETPAAPSPAPVAPPPHAAPAPALVASPDDHEPVLLEIEADMRDSAPQFVAELRDHMGGAEQTLLALEGHYDDRELLDALFRAFHTAKGVAGFMHLKPVVELAHAAEALMEAARSGKLALTPGIVDLILKSTDLLNQLLNAVEGRPAPTRGTVRLLIADLGRACAGGAISESAMPAAPVAETPVAPPAAPPSRPASEPADAAPEHAPARGPEASSPAPATQPAAEVARKNVETIVKVSTARMDSLIDLVGELVIANQMVVQDPAMQTLNEQRLVRNLSHAGKIVRDLQAVSMSLRMVAVKATFQKMSRLVRDVATKTGKKIELHMEGEDTELDRTIVDQINDPLVHIIRNACDHGVETPDDRVKSGKPPVGNVTIRAFHQGGEIVIEVEDDGRGLNRDKLIKKGIERGLIPPDRNTAEMPDSEVFNLIFLAGFSTAEKVTDISGRGVGMDVVRRNIEALRGKVELRSTFGKGSVIAMRLPLTLAIIDGMVVRVGPQRYVVPTLCIESSFRPQPSDVSTIEGGKAEMARVRDSLLPIFRLKKVFGLREGHDELAQGLLIVVDANNTRTCLMVDEIVGQQQVVIKSLGSGSPTVRGISGGAILGDGRVALILDAGALLQQAAGTAA